LRGADDASAGLISRALHALYGVVLLIFVCRDFLQRFEGIRIEHLAGRAKLLDPQALERIEELPAHHAHFFAGAVLEAELEKLFDRLAT